MTNNNSNNEDFNQIKNELVREIKGMREDMNRLFATVEFHDQALYGNKSDKPGAMEDLRVLKAGEATRKQNLFAIWTALVLAFAERIWAFFGGHH